MLKFKALADENRLRLAAVLSHYELSVNELVKILNIGQSRVSRNLKILAEAGLVRFRRDGLWVFYSAVPAGANADFLAAVLPYCPDADKLEADRQLAMQLLKEREKRARQFFNAIAENWDELNREVLGDFDLSARVLKSMPAKCDVAVDLGCGTGLVLETLRKHVENVIGVDGSSAMLEFCKKRLGCQSEQPGLSLRIGELNHLPLADKEADFICINLVLHHIADPAEVIAEIRRVLSSRGVLFIAEFLKHEDETMRLRYGDHWLGFDLNELEQFLAAQHFAIVATKKYRVGRNLSLITLSARPF